MAVQANPSAIRCRGIGPQAGFSLFELTVVIVLIGVFIAVALSRLLPWLDEAERVAVLRVEGQLRSSVVMEAARRIARGEGASIVELDGANPMTLLLEPPRNYVGELAAGTQQETPARHWYFDTGSRRLVYRLGAPFGLPVREKETQNPEFAVHVAYADVNGSGAFEAAGDELYGVRLERVAGVSWLSDGGRF